MVTTPSFSSCTTQYGTLPLDKENKLVYSSGKHASELSISWLQVPFINWGKQWPRLLDFIISALLGSTFSAVKSLGEEIENSMAVMLRFGICTLLLFPCCFKQKHWPSLCCGFLCGLPCFLGSFFQALALKHLSTARVALFCNLHILFLPIFQYFRGLTLHKHIWKAAICATLGIIALQADNTFWLTNSFFIKNNVGTFLAILQSIFYAMGYLIASESLSKYPSYYLPFTATYFGTIFGASFAWIYLDVHKGIWDGSPYKFWTFLFKFKEIPFLCTLIWTSIIVTLIPTVAESFILTKIPVTEHAIISSTIPLWSVLISWFLLEETFSGLLFLGVSLILAGCLLLEWEKFGVPPTLFPATPPLLPSSSPTTHFTATPPLPPSPSSFKSFPSTPTLPPSPSSVTGFASTPPLLSLWSSSPLPTTSSPLDSSSIA